MKIVATIARILLGVAFLVFGSNAILHFIPTPPMTPSMATTFATVLQDSHYGAVVGAVEVLGALLLLANRYVALGLTFLGPVLVNILIFHILMAPASIGMGVFFTILWFLVAYQHREGFAGLFVAKR